MAKIKSPAELEKLRKSLLAKKDGRKTSIAVCGGTGCHTPGEPSLLAAFEKEIEKHSLQKKVNLRVTGCPGLCEKGPIVVIHPEGICYTEVTPENVAEIVSQTVIGKKVVERLLYTDPATGKKITHEAEIPFYKNQMRLLIGNNSAIDPASIEDYIAAGGYAALVKTLEMTSEAVVKEITDSGLRGRSGGGFSVGRKWNSALKAEGETKYLICNCHEGDPGAFADRRMMEANPHAVIEGMLIGARATKANEGYIYIGDEFPLTVQNTETAIRQAEEYGLLGENILGSGLNFRLRLAIDAGNYVCGEMGALMESIEGKIAEPKTRYGHATEEGLFEKPTVVNNLQSWFSIPLIINEGAAKYSAIGTQDSKGTRVFSLVGAINNSGLIEVPMGTPLRKISTDIGGGIRDNKRVKAVMVGGPLGTFIPESQLDTPVGFDEMSKAGGSLGPSLIVLDENACMVDIVKYFLSFLADESCGKCTPCREGLRQMLKIMNRISEGSGRDGDIEAMETIAETQRPAALCALGQTASNPLRSALKHFRSEFEIHIAEKRCPANVCRIPAPTLNR